MNEFRHSLAVALLACLSMSGCGGSSDGSPPTAPAPGSPPVATPQPDTQSPTISATLDTVQRSLAPTATFGRVDSVGLSLSYADNVGVVKLVESVEGVSTVDGRSVLSATYDEAPVLQPSGLATLDTTAFPLGKYSVVLHAYDAAGNHADSDAVTFYVCETGPAKPEGITGLVCALPG